MMEGENGENALFKSLQSTPLMRREERKKSNGSTLCIPLLYFSYTSLLLPLLQPSAPHYRVHTSLPP